MLGERWWSIAVFQYLKDCCVNEREEKRINLGFDWLCVLDCYTLFLLCEVSC